MWIDLDKHIRKHRNMISHDLWKYVVSHTEHSPETRDKKFTKAVKKLDKKRKVRVIHKDNEWWYEWIGD